MINKELWTKFYELYKQYVAGYEKYSKAEVSFELDEILPTLLENLFNAWFPELKEVELIEVGDGNKYRLYIQFLQKNYIIILIVEVRKFTEKEELFIKRYSNNELEN